VKAVYERLSAEGVVCSLREGSIRLSPCAFASGTSTVQATLGLNPVNAV
jgi:hypothetical protein